MDMFNEYPDILTVEQVCKMLNIGKNMAYGLLRSGEIKSIKMGAKYRIPKTWVIEYFNDCIRCDIIEISTVD